MNNEPPQTPKAAARTPLRKLTKITTSPPSAHRPPRPTRRTRETFEADVLPTELTELEHQAKIRAIQRRRDLRPTNTRKAYDPCAAWFQQWARDEGYEQCHELPEPAVLVDGGRALRFVEYVVATGNRHIRKRDACIFTPISMATLEMHVKALVDLAKFQYNILGLPVPDIRDAPITSYVDNYRRDSFSRFKQAHYDRGTFNARDGYSSSQHVQICHELLSRGRPCDIRTLCEHLMCHSGMARSETSRFLQLVDLSSDILTGEGYTDMLLITLSMRRSKTNVDGQLQRYAMARASNPVTCPVAGLGMYLWDLFEVRKLPPPNLAQRAAWYNDYLFFTKSPQEGISEQAQLNAVTQIFLRCGVSCSDRTHARRRASARLAEAAECDYADIQRHGHWKGAGHLLGESYLTGYSRPVLRALAGFNCRRGGYFVPRAHSRPPDVLINKVFSWAPEAFREVRARRLTANQDLAAESFLSLVLTLRETVLQDLAILTHKYGFTRIFNHQLLRTPEFKSYSAQVHLQHTQEAGVQQEASFILNALPELQQSIEQQTQSTQHLTVELGALREELQSSYLQELRALESRFHTKLEAVLQRVGGQTTQGHRLPAPSRRPSQAYRGPPAFAPQDPLTRISSTSRHSLHYPPQLLNHANATTDTQINHQSPHTATPGGNGRWVFMGLGVGWLLPGWGGSSAWQTFISH